MRIEYKSGVKILKTGTIFFVFVFVFFIFPDFSLAKKGSARIKEEKMSIPTYLLGPEDINPNLWQPGRYPYPMQTEITDIKDDREYNAIVMENDYISVIILPELGGRMLAAHDKTYNNEDFIYHNHVIKYALIALRGAWLSGGIEWNFPRSAAHTVFTVSPVHYSIRNNTDGSVTTIVGGTEYLTRMQWQVALTVYPDKSYIEVVPCLYNRTLIHNNGYFWSNAAVHATEDCQVVFDTRHVFTWCKSNLFPWTVSDGVDKSWYKNIPKAADYFAGDLSDFFGVYYHEKDCGTVHYADRYECPGKKFWTWGTARSGEIWVDILTDNDGQYIEIQSGRIADMCDSWVFEPRMVEKWTEYWYPIKKMNGFTQANQMAALNCKVMDRSILISFNVTGTLKKGTLELISNGKELHKERIYRITPADYWNKKISLKEVPETFEVILKNAGGEEIIRYERKKDLEPWVQEPCDPVKHESQMTANELYNKGRIMERRWKFEKAVNLYRSALKKEPTLVPANVSMGLFLYKRGNYEKALNNFNKAVEVSEQDPKARYYRALTLLKMGRIADAEDDLQLSVRHRAFDHLVYYVLAELCMSRKDWSQAEKYLRNALGRNPDDYKAKAMLAAVLRKEGKTGKITGILNNVLKDNPIAHLAIAERYFLRKTARYEKSLKDFLKRGHQDCLELAVDYGNAGLYDEAIDVLGLYESITAKVNPLVLYYKGYYHKMRRDDVEAKTTFKKGFKLSPDYVFPNRLESLEVLKTVLEDNPKDWKAYYYMGNFFTANMRWEEGLEAYLKAEEIQDTYSVLHRNIAQILWKKKKDIKGAIEQYKKAIECNPDDYHFYVDLDHLYAGKGMNETRLGLLNKIPEKLRSNSHVLLQEAIIKVHTGSYDSAIKILKDNKYHPWEGWNKAHNIWVQANLGSGFDLLKEDNYKDALNRFESMLKYPENLGTGAPAEIVNPKTYCLIGNCYEKLGMKILAVENWEKASQQSVNREWSESSYYRALALKKLNKKEKAEKIFNKLIKNGDKRTIHTASDLYIQGLGYLGMGNKKKARQLFKKAIEKNSNFIDARLHLNAI